MDWESGFNGLPLVHGSLGWIECARERVLTIWDHHIIIGRVLRARTFDREPLVHWRGGYTLLDGCAAKQASQAA